MARAGLLGLQFYTPATQAWGQAHMQARFAILRVSGLEGVVQSRQTVKRSPSPFAPPTSSVPPMNFFYCHHQWQCSLSGLARLRVCACPPRMQVLLEAGEGFVTIVGQEAVTAATVATAVEGDDGVYVKLDESKIHSVGVPAIRRFLQEIQVYRVRGTGWRVHARVAHSACERGSRQCRSPAVTSCAVCPCLRPIRCCA